MEKGEAELEATKKELTDIKKVYPPKYFSSRAELVDWLKANDVSERPEPENAEQLYSRGLDIQEDALKDGGCSFPCLAVAVGGCGGQGGVVV